MASYHGPVCRYCRREGQKLFLKGDRCYTDKCAFERKNYAPGQHGTRKFKLSEYGVQMREKQKVRRVYGILEKTFRLTFRKASISKGVTSEVFFQNLELRLDSVVYRMGFARSRNEAKQVVSHDHIFVNGKKVNIPSQRLNVGDIVTVREKSAKVGVFSQSAESFNKRPKIPWFEVDHEKLTGKIVALPQRDDIQINVKDRLIVELYNK